MTKTSLFGPKFIAQNHKNLFSVSHLVELAILHSTLMISSALAISSFDTAVAGREILMF